MGVIAVVGAQWGDEGKGKVVDLLAGRAEVVVRAQGGDNAGHTVVNPLGKFALHLVPAGVFNPNTVAIIGAGVALNPLALLVELEELRERGVEANNLVVSPRAHLVMPYHRMLDQAEELRRGDARIGTTGRGIGPTYVDKVARVGLRAGDMLDEQTFRAKLRSIVEQKNRLLAAVYDAEPLGVDELVDQLVEVSQDIRRYIADPLPILEDATHRAQTILIEGAHGTLLDLDYGSYPYVTSSSPTVAGLLLGAGIAPRHLTLGLGVYKAYQSRVGAGPMPTELLDDVGDLIREAGHEYGTTTGRPRRCGWFDAVAGRFAAQINGFHRVALTRLDVLDQLPTLKVCVAYEVDGRRLQQFPAQAEELERCSAVYEELPGWGTPTGAISRWGELPAAARRYVDRIAELIGVPIGLIGVGQDRHQSISLDASIAA